jgi:hypothetical protein
VFPYNILPWTHSSIFFSEIFTAESSECEPDKSTADIFDSGSDGSYIDDLDNDFVPTSDLEKNMEECVHMTPNQCPPLPASQQAHNYKT